MKLTVGQLVIHDGFLVEVVLIEDNTYYLKSFIGPRVMYSLENIDSVITDILNRICYINTYDYQWTIIAVRDECLELKRTDQDGAIYHKNFYYTKQSKQNQGKQSNPKDAIGCTKVSMSTLSGPVLMEMALGMTEGAIKYGKHNYREIGVRYSIYFDAAMRHLWAAIEGEDIDTVSGLPHIVKAMTCLHVLRDAQIRGKCYDDRPIGTVGYIDYLNNKSKTLIDNAEEIKEPFLANGKEPDKYNG